MVLNSVIIDSPVGRLGLAEKDGLLCEVCFDSQWLPQGSTSALLQEAIRQLDEYFAGARRDFDLPLQLHGSEFQQRIWQQLRRIPYGQVSSYGEVALDAGYPRAARAVGNACNRNHLAIVVPCHRVVAANSLGGFGHRMDIKLHLLRLEGYLK